MILPGLLGIMITHSRETYQPTSIMRWDRGIFHGSCVFEGKSRCVCNNTLVSSRVCSSLKVAWSKSHENLMFMFFLSWTHCFVGPNLVLSCLRLGSPTLEIPKIPSNQFACGILKGPPQVILFAPFMKVDVDVNKYTAITWYPFKIVLSYIYLILWTISQV